MSSHGIIQPNPALCDLHFSKQSFTLGTNLLGSFRKNQFASRARVWWGIPLSCLWEFLSWFSTSLLEEHLHQVWLQQQRSQHHHQTKFRPFHWQDHWQVRFTERKSFFLFFLCRPLRSKEEESRFTFESLNINSDDDTADNDDDTLKKLTQRRHLFQQFPHHYRSLEYGQNIHSDLGKQV